MQVGDIVHLDGLKAEYSLSAAIGSPHAHCPTDGTWLSALKTDM